MSVCTIRHWQASGRLTGSIPPRACEKVASGFCRVLRIPPPVTTSHDLAAIWQKSDEKKEIPYSGRLLQELNVCTVGLVFTL